MNETEVVKRERGFGQRIAYGLALMSYTLAVVLVAALAFFDESWNRGTEDSIIASMMAGVVFLIGVGIVLHVVGKANLPDLSMPRD